MTDWLRDSLAGEGARIVVRQRVRERVHALGREHRTADPPLALS